ncbi:MAG: 23S rRNA (pseudouridine(1915)-N(3))-methyltransferase RlmH [Bacteroidales bacterium]|nr:23S rRNA (pseudouridine(1915)-N(3))-methyltransferase RlmH [Bacteroidales bacterium]MDD2424873.1 23S rRNA (pseudouridine(1915)-N(3))-methyltransferase RlmH [Bacteroidales bacterium]MDD3990099.1 23S rRNA (pseudouridine(1915)-N(3))-methyltransferase RlmH [Bacteroidales bacterium]MDD4638957.1 23S rRNA (pseudouridine(1915)-N(3))-methyltransferase RlmH [Bacteroidales bacterium]
MKTILLLSGKSETSWLDSAMRLYEDRLERYTSYTRVEIPGLRQTGALTEDQVKEREGDLMLKRVKDSDFLVLLDEKGEELSSVEFARYLEKRALSATKSIVFAVGGAFGFPPRLYQRANYRLSLSRMTLPHQLVRLFFLEQLYRANTIINGEPYHHI